MAGGNSPSDKQADIYTFIASIGLVCLVSIILLTGRILVSDSLRYIFLLWNLVLAVIPLLLAWWLSDRLKTESWFAWPQIVLSFIFIGFLPNTFYLITDFVHLQQSDQVSLYFDVVMLSSFVFCGVILGFVSIFLIHRQLLRRLNERKSMAIVALVFFLASFAAYLGRFTRFNSWDIILRPAGLLFDVSDRFINPTEHGDTYLATITLFIVLMSIYFVVYSSAKLLRK